MPGHSEGSMKKAAESPAAQEELTEKELDVITTVFRSYETGLREATILPKDLHAAMKMLGLNPMEQEIIDLTNNIVRNGYIYFPEFCAVILKKFREDDEDVFNQNMFKILCGTEKFPEKFKAKKYKLHDHFIDKKNFHHMMTNLPEQVSEEDIEEMFRFADKDNDGKISFLEFQTMIKPPKPDESNNNCSAIASNIVASKQGAEVVKKVKIMTDDESHTDIIEKDKEMLISI